MDYRLSEKCPFFHDDTPSWNWCHRPCMCRKNIASQEAQKHSFQPGVAKAPNYGFPNRTKTTPQDLQKLIAPPPKKKPANTQPVSHPVSHKPVANKPPVSHTDPPVSHSDVANTVANTVANKKPRRDPEARKAYQRELMRKRRAAKKSEG